MNKMIEILIASKILEVLQRDPTNGNLAFLPQKKARYTMRSQIDLVRVRKTCKQEIGT